VLLPPLSYTEFFAAYVLAAVVRGMVVGAAVMLVTLPFVDMEFAILNGSSLSPLRSAVLGALGMMAGIWAEKIAKSPRSRTSSSCRSHSSRACSTRSIRCQRLQHLSHFNPFFYVIDGFRYVLRRLGHRSAAQSGRGRGVPRGGLGSDAGRAAKRLQTEALAW